MTRHAAPPSKLRRCQLVYRQDHGEPSRCHNLPRFLVELTDGERSQRMWVCRDHAQQKTYDGSGCTVSHVAPEVDDLIAQEDPIGAGPGEMMEGDGVPA